MADKYLQRNDGEWSDVTDGQSVACCDCGLVHYTEYVVLDGRILKRVFREVMESGRCCLMRNVYAVLTKQALAKMSHYTLKKKILIMQLADLAYEFIE